VWTILRTLQLARWRGTRACEGTAQTYDLGAEPVGGYVIQCPSYAWADAGRLDQPLLFGLPQQVLVALFGGQEIKSVMYIFVPPSFKHESVLNRYPVDHLVSLVLQSIDLILV
jgi:hypothetical protein